MDGTFSITTKYSSLSPFVHVLVKILKKQGQQSVIELSELLIPCGHKYSTYLLLGILKTLPHNPGQSLIIPLQM